MIYIWYDWLFWSLEMGFLSIWDIFLCVFRPGGLVVGQLNKISFYEKKQDNQYRLHMLPLEGKDGWKYLGFGIFM